MLIKDFMIALVIFGVVAYCIGGSIYVLNAEYNTTPIDLAIIDNMGDDVEGIRSTSTSLYGSIGNNSITAGGESGALFEGIGNFFRVITGIITTPIEWILTLSNEFGVPNYIAVSLVTLLVLALTFAIINAIMRRGV